MQPGHAICACARHDHHHSVKSLTILTFSLLLDRQNDRKVLILENLLVNHLSPVQTMVVAFSKSSIPRLNGG